MVGISINEVSVTEEVVLAEVVLEVLPVREDEVLVSGGTEVLVVLQLVLGKDEQEAPVSISGMVHMREWEVALFSSAAKEAVSLVSSVRKEELALLSWVEAVLISSVRRVLVSLPPEAEDRVLCDEEAVDSEMARLSREGFTPE